MSLNLYGNDINLLVKLLEEKFYIRAKWVSKKEGLLLYDDKVEEAVKHFQKDAGVSQTGQVATTDLQNLKQWDKEKTTAALGVRDLYIDSMPMYGTDVDELVLLLGKNGLIPDTSEIVKKGGHAVFTKDIEMAVKLYQILNDMTDTGRVDEAFVKSIKKQTK